MLERLILQEIQVQRAGRLGVQVPDEMLNEALRDVAKRNNIEFEQMPRALEQQGIDYATYREEMRREIMLSMLRQRDVFPRIYVSPREVEQALERDASQAGVNTEYDVSHILLSLPESATTDEMAKVEATARDVHSRAAAGEDFGQLALAYSKAQSALERGKLGWRRMGQLPQFIGDLVIKMNPGDVSEPVRTPTGFHIVRLDGTRGGESGPVMVEQLHVAPHPDAPERGAGRRDHAPAPVRDPRPHPRGRGLRARSPASPRRTRAPRAAAATSAGPRRAPSTRRSRRSSRGCRPTRSASHSAPSSDGISFSSWAGAPTTRATSCAGSAS